MPHIIKVRPAMFQGPGGKMWGQLSELAKILGHGCDDVLWKISRELLDGKDTIYAVYENAPSLYRIEDLVEMDLGKIFIDYRIVTEMLGKDTSINKDKLKKQVQAKARKLAKFFSTAGYFIFEYRDGNKLFRQQVESAAMGMINLDNNKIYRVETGRFSGGFKWSLIVYDPTRIEIKRTLRKDPNFAFNQKQILNQGFHVLCIGTVEGYCYYLKAL